MKSSEVDENSGVDRNSVKFVDKSSVVVQNTGLNLEGLDEKAVVDQRVFSLFILLPRADQASGVGFSRLKFSSISS